MGILYDTYTKARGDIRPYSYKDEVLQSELDAINRTTEDLERTISAIKAHNWRYPNRKESKWRNW